MSSDKTEDAKSCGEKCSTTSGCTHFSWYDGTCNMKNGVVSKSDAKQSSTPGIVCGIVIISAAPSTTEASPSK